MKIIITIKVFN